MLCLKFVMNSRNIDLSPIFLIISTSFIVLVVIWDKKAPSTPTSFQTYLSFIIFLMSSYYSMNAIVYSWFNVWRGMYWSSCSSSFSIIVYNNSPFISSCLTLLSSCMVLYLSPFDDRCGELVVLEHGEVRSIIILSFFGVPTS